MPDLSSQISALEDQLENLRRQKMIEDEATRRLTPEQKMAIQLHELMCTWNHTDGCAWHYEINPGKVHDWNGREHQGWLGQTRRIAAFCDKKHLALDDAIEIFKVFKSVR